MAKVTNQMHIDRERGIRKTTIKEWPLEKLRLDPQNVRFKHLEKVMSDKEIEEHIWQESDTKDLYRAILASGGLSEKPYVTLDGIVKEGNRRLVCLRKAKETLKKDKDNEFNLAADTFDKVTVEVFQEGITLGEMDLWLARIHVGGKKQWAALNQASHLFGLYHDRGYSYEQIREYLGVGKAEVMRKIQAYNATREYMKTIKDSKITDYSFFEELHKKRPLSALFEGDPAFRKNIFKWIHEGKFDDTGAKDMRILEDILKDPVLKSKFEEKGMRAAKFEMQKKNPALGNPVFKSIDAALSALRSMPRDTLRGLSQNKNQIELLEQLRDEVILVLKET